MAEETILKQQHTGRTGIGHPNRDARSLRAFNGIIQIIESNCPRCAHKKAQINTSVDSPFKGTRKCTKCKHRWTP